MGVQSLAIQGVMIFHGSLLVIVFFLAGICEATYAETKAKIKTNQQKLGFAAEKGFYGKPKGTQILIPPENIYQTDPTQKQHDKIVS